MKRRLASLAFALVALALAAPVALAQEPPAPAEAPAAPPEPTFIPVAQIPSRAGALAAELEVVRAEVESREVETAVEESIPEREEELAARKTDLEVALTGRHSAQQLETVEGAWRELVGKLTTAQEGLSERAQELEALSEDLKLRREVWNLTRTNARAQGAPPSVTQNVKDTLASLARVDKELQASRNNALELEGRVGKLTAEARAALDRIAKARAELRARTFVQTAPPLWRAGEDASALASEVTGAGGILAAAGRDAAVYARGNPDRMSLSLMLVAVLVWAIRRARAILEGEGRAAPDSLRHAVPSALVVAGSLNATIHALAPVGFNYLVGILLLPFWIRVLLALLPPVFKAPAYVFGVLVVLAAVSLLIGDTPLLPRLLELALFGTGLTGTLWLRRPSRLAELPRDLRRSRWARLLSFWLHVAIAGFGVGTFASILGYGNLTALLTNVVVIGTVIGTVFLLAVRITESLVEALVVRGTFDRLRMIRARPSLFLRVTRTGLRAFGFFMWAHRTLVVSGLWDPVSAGLAAILGASVGYGAVSISLGGVIFFGITLWLAWLLARLVSFTLEEEIFPRVRLAPGVPFALSSFTRYAILVLGFITAVGVLGFPLDRLTLVVSALGVGIGFGLQNIVNNFVSGVILLFERPVRVGDLIELDSLFGFVTTIGIRASRVRTFDGSDVLVPNGDLIAARVTNWTLSDKKRRIEFPVGVAYGTDPDRVLAILHQVASDHPEVLEQPGPEALFRAFGDSSLDFALRCWTESDRGLYAVQSDLLVGINAALAEAGIEIPFPQRDLHLRSVDPSVRRPPGASTEE